MTIETGTKLGRFEILSKIGEGGMGEVYLAQDLQLDRKVALKILPGHLAANHDRMRRFVQEAKAAAALNHPNIAHIYEIGEDGDANFIAMEFVEGVTLREKIHREKIELRKLLRYLQHVAEGLAKAHAAGIVHRDLKPDNIMITREGHAKILDFGLAKLIEQPPVPGGESSEVATAVIPRHSAPGTVMGTVGYMSPEQAQGKTNEIDQRSDIFSLGCILFEAATGKKPFEGESVIKSLHMVVYESAPPIAELNPSAPADLQRIVRRCLAKDADERYQTIKDVAIELKDLRREMQGTGIDTTVTPPTRSESTGSAGGEGTRSPSFSPTTGSPSLTTKASSAEYVVTGIKQHKLAAAVSLVVLVTGITALALYVRGRSANAIKSIAVMPFVNEGGNSDVEYLSDGITETLISSLSNIPNLSVKASSTVFFYKGKHVSPKQIGEELGVQVVLLGRLFQRGDDLKLNVELVNTATQDVMWGDQFDSKMNDLVLVQSEIAKEVAAKISSKLSGDDQKKVAKTYTNNPEAYQAYLKGRFFWNQRTGEGFNKGIEYFRQAIEMDPNYALAWSGLADSYFLLPEYGSYSPKEYLPKAKQAAEKAIELDPNLAEAQTSLAYIEHTYDWKFREAEDRYKKAIELNPNYATAYQWYSELLLEQRRFDEAQRVAKKAVELDPLSLIKNVGYGQTYFFAKQYSEAEVLYRKVLEIKPEFAVANRQLARSLAAQDKIPEALRESDKAYESGGESFKFSKGVIYASAGDRENANRFITEYKDLDSRQMYDTSVIHALMGEDAKAIDGVEILIERRSVFVLYINVDPDFDRIRNNLRFKNLMKQVGFGE